MLATDDVDDDYFTPIASTSLASLFGNSSLNEGGAENESLKYTPPKAKNDSKPQQSKATECIFACAVSAYQWYENDYSAKGKIGFAVLKNIKDDSLKIVLYDSNKITLSSTTVTSNLEVTVKGNTYFSYYDNLNKYWSINATDEEINKITLMLQKLNVIVSHSSNTDKGLPVPVRTNNEIVAIKDTEIVIVESDTDYSLNKKTKESILNRMANMGQSVLPRRTESTERSDSSDTSATNNHKTMRHKLSKNIVKRINTDSNASEVQSLTEMNHMLIPTVGKSSNIAPVHGYINSHVVPASVMPTENHIVTPTHSNKLENDLNYFMTEQRISNSELRINVARMTDRLDQVLDKMKYIENSDGGTTSNFQVEIMKKLLHEYENKITVYEQIMTPNKDSNVINIKPINIGVSNSEVSDIELYKSKITNLEEMVTQKDKEITFLNECILQSKNISENIEMDTCNETRLLKEIMDLKYSLQHNQEELAKSNNKLKDIILKCNCKNNDYIESKLKYVMNDTYRAIVVNFESNNNYSGDTIKSVVATVIKQVTLDSLNKFELDS